MTWRRYKGDRLWHTGRDTISSFVTFCHGRWPLSDEAEGLVERSENPPHEERCEPCERQRIEEQRIEQGLRELRAADISPTWPEFDLSDVPGGET